MVRRTRTEIEKYFAEDLKRNNVKFPEVEDPEPFYYQLNDHEDRIFMETVELITQKFKYARYMPLLYLTKPISQLKEQSQRNMGGFMKVLLVKRLESSFYAFRKSVDRFIYSYEMFIKEYEKGNVYISKGYINKIFELLDQDNDEAVQKFIDEGKAEEYESKDFRPDFIMDLKNDLEILKQIKSMWQSIKRDPKIETLLYNLKNHDILKNKKIIIFTESKETAEYLTENINNHIGKIVLLFHGSSPELVRDRVIENFDAMAKNKKDDYKILVSTEVLSEGVNLHRSNIVINYDIPWNPTRLMQRVGRVNRIGTEFDKIYTFNFFPTKQADSEIELTNIARSKIEAFLTLLGGDSSILTEGEPVSSHELFDKLLSKKTLIEDEEEGESELKYLRFIEDIRNENPELFERIKRLPKKARSAKMFSKSVKDIASENSLITFFKKGKLNKYFISDKNSKLAIELDFLNAAKILESSPDEKRTKIPLEDYYELLDMNKSAFFNATVEEIVTPHQRGGTNNEINLLKILKVTQKNSKQMTEEQEEYLKKIINRLEEGALPKETVKKTLDELNVLGQEIQNPLKVIGVLQRKIPIAFLKSHYAETSVITEDKREVILSLYLAEESNG
jgi:superfamily II DNA/RNA helicase